MSTDKPADRNQRLQFAGPVFVEWYDLGDDSDPYWRCTAWCVACYRASRGYLYLGSPTLPDYTQEADELFFLAGDGCPHTGDASAVLDLLALEDPPS